mmetsp:Transcript_36902/g.95239  ORF Transcript_36902/g.95239 Transcript_36902/m.95239 type:complete len:1129 (+) Transcript_36902:187-3573(+)
MAVDKAYFVELLTALSSGDNNTRQKAETMYQQAKQTEPDKLMIGMLAVLGSTELDENVRRHDAVLLRQQMMRGHEKDFVFSRISAPNKGEVAAELLRRFEAEPVPKLQKKIGEVVAKLAEYVCDKDDPRGSLAPGQGCGWPGLLEMVFRMADPSSSPSKEACESSLRLLTALVPTLKDDIVAAKQQLGQILQLGLLHADLKIKTAGVLLICEIVGETDKKAWAPLAQTAGVVVQVLTQLAAANEEEMLQECVQSLIDVASLEPDFFKAQLQLNMEPAKFMATVARTREGIDGGLRNLALEWLVTFVEKRQKWLTKNCKDYHGLVLQACMDLMLEVEDGQEELKAWAERMDDEEGEEDEDELFHAGEEAIDRVAEAVSMETLGQALFQLIGHFCAQAPWQAKHAGLAAIKQTVEYVEEKAHVDEMTKMLLQHVDHPHPRVRYTALHAIGQLANDQAPTFQESWHQTVMPCLLKKMDDECDRVAAMAMSAFVSFGEELDNSLMAGYAGGFMQKLVAKLQATKHRGVREESITSIGVIAGVIEKDFSQYYDGIMPMLKQFVMHATGEKENRLRGKSFECMSLLGIAVGKEKFLPDAGEAIQAMMRTQLQDDDIQREYIKEASERICHCLKKDFAPFLPNLLQGIFRSLKLEEIAAADPQNQAPSGHQNDDEDDDDAYIQVSTGDGKLVRVRTTKFEEMMQSVQLLHTFVTEMEGAYFDWVAPTAEVLVPLLSSTDEISMLCDEVRGIALQTWSLLIKSARQGGEERNQGTGLAQELLKTGLMHTFTVLEKNQEPEMLSETASGITECIKNVGPGILGPQEVQQLVEKAFLLMEQSFNRTQQIEKTKQERAKIQAGLPQDLGDGEEDDEDPDGEEEQLRRNYEEVLGAIMKVSPAEFMACLPKCGQCIGAWLQQKQNKVLALYLACDLIQHLKEQSESIWPVFMPEVFKGLGDEDADVRIASAYAVNLAAPLPRFAEAAPEAFRRLAQIINGAKPKKRDDKGKLALDNAVAALLMMAKEKPQQCPAEIQAWQIVVGKLPLRDDEDEAKKVHKTVVDLVMAQHEGLLGGPNRDHLGPVLSILAEVYKVDGICEKETDEKILKVFKMLPRDLLQGLAPRLTEKQQKKIEKMLSS